MKEAENNPIQDQEQPFVFTENEKLFERVSHTRFLACVKNPNHRIYRAGVSSNFYGEFLFVAVGLNAAGREEETYTFFGLGLHIYRDRYLLDEWHFYRSTLTTKGEPLAFNAFETMLDERRDEVEPLVAWHHQSSRGQSFDEIADLSDDDGAIADMEDFPEFFDGLDDE